LRCSAIDLLQVVRRQLNVDSADVLLESVLPGRPGNRRDPRLLRQQPGQRYLRRRCALPRGEGLQPLDVSEIRFPVLLAESWKAGAEVRWIERRLLVHLAGEKAPAKRAERHEPDAELLQRRQHVVLGLPPPQ